MSGNWKITWLTVLLWAGLGCNYQDPLQEELRRLHEQTIPVSAKHIERSQLVRSGSHAAATWAFESDQDWESYATWVVGNLPTYTLVSKTSQLRLVRKLSGDVFELQLYPTPGNTEIIRHLCSPTKARQYRHKIAGGPVGG